jgi:hypothetical protein
VFWLRRRQFFAIDQADHTIDASRNPAGKIAGLEFWRDVLVDDALGGGVGQGAFEAVTDLDAQMSIVFGDDQQRTVVDLLAADLPGLGNADRELVDRLRVRRRHDQHGNLAAFSGLEVAELLRQRGDVAARQRAGAVDHAAGELRYGDVGEGGERPAK